MAQQFFIEAKDYASLKGSVVVITGGSSGIGLATAKVLLETGAFVVVGDLNPSPVKHVNHSYLKTDVTKWSNLLALFALAKEKHGRVDHTFANAGISARADYFPQTIPDTASLEEPNTLTYDINLKGCINTAYIGLHYLRSQKSDGSIVVTGSASSFQAFGVSDYCSAKHGVLGFMRGITPNLPSLLPQKIRINCIGPSWTLTGIVPKELCDAAGLETQEPDVVGQQVAVLMADEKRNGEFIYSVGGRHFEIEKAVFEPAVKVAVGSDGEQEGWERLKEAAGGMSTGDLADAAAVKDKA